LGGFGGFGAAKPASSAGFGAGFGLANGGGQSSGAGFGGGTGLVAGPSLSGALRTVLNVARVCLAADVVGARGQAC
jgi:hypothetical protein